jgi:hypothetical protein
VSSGPAAANDDRPLLAVICRVPIVAEAAGAAVGDVMTVRSFAPSRDTSGLLAWLRPDGIVVDSEEEAAAATPFAIESGAPLVHVELAERKLRILREGRWSEPDGVTVTSEAVRNIIVGGIFGKGKVG